jgi:hypothetical protein
MLFLPPEKEQHAAFATPRMSVTCSQKPAAAWEGWKHDGSYLVAATGARARWLQLPWFALREEAVGGALLTGKAVTYLQLVVGWLIYGYFLRGCKMLKK